MIEILKQCKVIPVVVIEDLKDAVPLATALVNGGLKVLEITLRTHVALDAVSEIKKALPNAIVGTGTVLNANHIQDSINVGADFMVSPGATENMLKFAHEKTVKFLPGAATASEMLALLERGFTCQKFFPAQASGGANMLKAISGPLPQIKFCPTGGISLNNAMSYLSLPNVLCIGGSWMLDKTLVSKQDWSAISLLAKNASKLR